MEGYGKKGLLFQLYNIIGDDGSNVPDKKSDGSAVASVLSVWFQFLEKYNWRDIYPAIQGASCMRESNKCNCTKRKNEPIMPISRNVTKQKRCVHDTIVWR